MFSVFKYCAGFLTILLPILASLFPPVMMSLLDFLSISSPLKTSFIQNQDKIMEAPLPEHHHPDAKSRFFLYDASAESLPDKLILIKDNSTEPAEGWKKDAIIKVLIHGYHNYLTYTGIDVMESNVVIKVAEEYATCGEEMNIVLMDWSSLAIRLDYGEAAKNTGTAGLQLAKFLHNLNAKNVFSDWDDIHLVGFSLGAHLSGVAGHEVQRMTGGLKIGRITGIDPAGPLFDPSNGELPTNTSGFLDKKDAQFVDILHCNMGIVSHWSITVIKPTMGSVVQAGHADFYPNGGSHQRSTCSLEQDQKFACSHKACMSLYAYSVKAPPVACPCDSWADYQSGECECDLETGGAYMGAHCDSSARGKYYLYLKDKVKLSDLMKEKAQDIISPSKYAFKTWQR